MIEINKRGSGLAFETATSKDVPEPTTQRKSTTMITRRARKRKKNRRRIAAAAVGTALLFLLVFGIVKVIGHTTDGTQANAEPVTTEQATEQTAAPETELRIVYFVIEGENGEPCYIDMDEMTSAWAAEAGFERRYKLTDEERYEVAQVVMAEAGAECFAGQMAVAQCILQAAEDDGIRPTEVLTRYAYSTRRPDPSQSTLNAVMQVFDFGNVVTDEPIKYFYNPAIVTSSFHESQIYVTTIGGHAFFKEKKEE